MGVITMDEKVKVCPICGRPILWKDWVYDIVTKVLVHEKCAIFLEHDGSDNDV